ncbi:unnamed protein product, partial [Closterium sp. Naga37s-1]
FARSEGDGGAVPVSFTGTNSLIWAFSESGSTDLAFHGNNAGSMNVDFTCQTAPAAGTSSSDDDDNDDDDNGGDDDDDDDDDDDGEEEEDENQSSGSTSAAAAASGSGSQACQPSTLPGYSCSVQLKGKDNPPPPPFSFLPPIHFTTPVSFILHWKTGANTVAMAADVATSGWVAIGWSKSSKMYPADAAIGNLPPGTLANGAAVGAYHMSGYGLSDVALTSSFELTNTTTTTANGRTTITFERPLSGFDRPVSVGAVPISSSGATSVLWAFSAFERPLSVGSVPFSSSGATSVLWAFSWSKPDHPSPFPHLIHPSPPAHSFERPLSVGSVPISSSGATNVLFAFSRLASLLFNSAYFLSPPGFTSPATQLQLRATPLSGSGPHQQQRRHQRALGLLSLRLAATGRPRAK